MSWRMPAAPDVRGEELGGEEHALGGAVRDDQVRPAGCGAGDEPQRAVLQPHAS
jgi:hypothetical protein